MTKIIPLEEAPAFAPPGSTVALGGAWLSNHPMAVVRELVRAGARGLHLVDELGSVDVDLLVGAGVVDELTFSMVSLEAFGLAPNVRRAVESGTLAIHEVSGVAMNVAYEAGARALPYLPMRDLGGSQLPDLAPERYRAIACPFTGEPLLAVRALNPDVAFLHVLRADAEGNCQVEGPFGVDPEIARAARRVVVTCEELVDADVIAARPETTQIPGFLVDAVIEAPFGAHPTTHVPRYGFDAWSVMAHADAAADGPGGPIWAEHLALLRAEDEAGYRERVLGDGRREVLEALVHTGPTLDEEPA